MSRPLRIELTNAIYHVVSHGNGELWLFKEERDHHRLLDILGNYSIKYRILVHAFLLMRNHLHLVIETKEPNLSLFMSQFLREFAMYYNKDRKRKGSVFKSRYGAFIIQKEKYYENVIRYVFYNPVKAGISKTPYEYRWSSLYYIVNYDANDEIKWFDQSISLSLLGGIEGLSNLLAKEPEELQVIFKTFIGDKSWAKQMLSVKELNKEISGSAEMMGSELTAERILGFVSQHYGVDKNEIIRGKDNYVTLVAMYAIWKMTYLNAFEAGEIFGLKKYAYSQRLCRFRKRLLNEKSTEEEVNKLLEKLKESFQS